MITYIKKLFFIDTFFLCVLFSISCYIISFYFSADYINTGYQDWMVHAYRIKLLQESGFVSWTHEWANGIAIWKSYQFLPHVFTLLLAEAFHLSPARAMVWITVFLFVFIRISFYTCLRFLSFHPLTAFFCAIVSFDIAQFWGGVSDFSLLFGFAFFPLLLFLWVKFYQGSIQYLFPYLVGLAFYVHPILGYTTCTLMVGAIVISSQKLLSTKTYLQFGVFLITSSLFWFPIVFKTSYTYTSPFLSNVFFLRQVIQNYPYLGFSAIFFLIIPASIAGIFLSYQKEKQWANILYFFSFGYFLLFLIGITYPLPRFIGQLQFTRGATIIAYSFLFVFALLLEKLFRSNFRFLKLVVLLFIIPVIIDGEFLRKTYAPLPVSHISDAISQYVNEPMQGGKIWTSAIGPSSYFSPLTYQFPYSYMGQLDPNIISPRISQLLLYEPASGSVPESHIVRMTEYFKITGTKYAFFEEGSNFTHALQTLSTKNQYIDLGVVRSYDTLSHVFQVPFEPISASILSPRNASKLFLFDQSVGIDNTTDQVIIDQSVYSFNKLIYQKDNLPLHVVYPSNDTIQLSIPTTHPSNTVYLAESYDTDWHATIRGKSINIKPIGPNFMKLTIPSGISGTVVMYHSFPMYLIICTFLIFLTGMQVVVFSLKRLFTYETTI